MVSNLSKATHQVVGTPVAGDQGLISHASRSQDGAARNGDHNDSQIGAVEIVNPLFETAGTCGGAKDEAFFDCELGEVAHAHVSRNEMNESEISGGAGGECDLSEQIEKENASDIFHDMEEKSLKKVG